ncbi:MAG TPA: helix-turn-helix transcriptional regulator [Prolixibacteraceae bacterium]|nr:helix-turn-helix transcriptional regulator [Prolixibacteraceae bacterium]
MKNTNKTLKLIVERTDTGYSAYAKDFPIFTTGRTINDLQKNAYEAVNLFFEEEGIQIRQGTIQFEIDFQQFFKYYNVLNAKFLAEKIGMNPTLLSQYVNGRKKPSKVQAEKIIHGIHQIGNELSEISLLYS